MELLNEALFSAFPLTELSAGDAASCKAGPMRFHIRHFAAEGLGHLALMQGSAMLGLMKMDTVILAPTHRDAPLFSYDRIRAMGQDTFILEYYDTLADPSLRPGLADLDRSAAIADLPDHDLGAHWYDPLKMQGCVSKRAKGCADRFDAYYTDSLRDFLARAAQCPAVDPAVKKGRTKAYVDGLFENGGPSTDAFVKAIGREAAEMLFHTVIFGL